MEKRVEEERKGEPLGNREEEDGQKKPWHLGKRIDEERKGEPGEQSRGGRIGATWAPGEMNRRGEKMRTWGIEQKRGCSA